MSVEGFCVRLGDGQDQSMFRLSEPSESLPGSVLLVAGFLPGIFQFRSKDVGIVNHNHIRNKPVFDFPCFKDLLDHMYRQTGVREGSKTEIPSPDPFHHLPAGS